MVGNHARELPNDNHDSILYAREGCKIWVMTL